MAASGCPDALAVGICGHVDFITAVSVMALFIVIVAGLLLPVYDPVPDPVQ